ARGPARDEVPCVTTDVYVADENSGRTEAAPASAAVGKSDEPIARINGNVQNDMRIGFTKIHRRLAIGDHKHDSPPTDPATRLHLCDRDFDQYLGYTTRVLQGSLLIATVVLR